MAQGVFTAVKKDGSVYYRSSITYKNTHISLGSFNTPVEASKVYTDALNILSDKERFFVNPDDHSTGYQNTASGISFQKYISIINYRDNGIYIKTPIYLCRKYFLYFLSVDNVIIFSTDDLFYYSHHTIMCRGGYYFVNDYGIQTSILSRYGIRNHSVKGKDYIFKNKDEHDYRYENILVINRYNGVSKTELNGITSYKSRIHINGDFTIGVYPSEIMAAIAYNKAADLVEPKISKKYVRNYIEGASSIEYASIYNNIKLNTKFRNYVNSLTDSIISD